MHDEDGTYTILDNVKVISLYDEPYRWIKEMLMKLNIPAFTTVDAIVKVGNYSASLPDDFKTMWSLWRYDAKENTKEFSELQQYNPYYYFKTDQDYCKTDECDVDCKLDFQEDGDIRVTKIYLKGPEVTNTYCNRKPISIVNRVANLCDSEAPDVRGAEHEAYLTDRKVTFNFKEGFVHLQYFAFVVDEDGLPMIPDVVQIENVIETYIIYKFFVEQFYNATDVAQKLKTAKELHDEAYRSAIAWVKLPSVKAMLGMINKRSRRFTRYEQRYSRR